MVSAIKANRYYRRLKNESIGPLNEEENKTQARLNTSLILVTLLFSAAFGECEPNWKAGNGPPSIGLNSPAYALTVYNGDLIAGGYFTKAGGVDVNRIARWGGSSWQPLGRGMNGMVEALTV